MKKICVVTFLVLINVNGLVADSSYKPAFTPSPQYREMLSQRADILGLPQPGAYNPLGLLYKNLQKLENTIMTLQENLSTLGGTQS